MENTRHTEGVERSRNCSISDDQLRAVCLSTGLNRRLKGYPVLSRKARLSPPIGSFLRTCHVAPRLNPRPVTFKGPGTVLLSTDASDSQRAVHHQTIRRHSPVSRYLAHRG